MHQVASQCCKARDTAGCTTNPTLLALPGCLAASIALHLWGVSMGPLSMLSPVGLLFPLCRWDVGPRRPQQAGLTDVELCSLCAGVVRALRKDDYITSTYRDHVHALSKGVPAKNIMAELFGKKTGICRGQGGSMHMFSREHNLVGGTVVAVCPLCACSADSTTLSASGGSVSFSCRLCRTLCLTLCRPADSASQLVPGALLPHQA